MCGKGSCQGWLWRFIIKSCLTWQQCTHPCLCTISWGLFVLCSELFSSWWKIQTTDICCWNCLNFLIVCGFGALYETLPTGCLWCWDGGFGWLWSLISGITAGWSYCSVASSCELQGKLFVCSICCFVCLSMCVVEMVDFCWTKQQMEPQHLRLKLSLCVSLLNHIEVTEAEV